MHPVKKRLIRATLPSTSVSNNFFNFFTFKTFLPLLYKQSCHQYGAALLDLIHNTLELFIELWK